MPKAKATRKQLFQASLALAGLTAAEWAEREGITPQHLSYVLNERRESKRLIEKVDAFAKKHLSAPPAMAG